MSTTSLKFKHQQLQASLKAEGVMPVIGAMRCIDNIVAGFKQVLVKIKEHRPQLVSSKC